MNDDCTQVIMLPDGKRTTLGADDLEFQGGNVPDAPQIVNGDTLTDALNTHMPEQWIRARARAWLENHESPGKMYWVGTYVGKHWVFCASHRDSYRPPSYRVAYALRICQYLNRECAHGGVWLAGWIKNATVFYLLWKDPDGDIAIPIECEKPFMLIKGWDNETWAEHAEQAWALWSERNKQLEIKPGQQVKLAQGQQPSPGHANGEPAIGL